MNDESNFSGLFVNADGIMHEGEPTRWLQGTTSDNTDNSKSTSTEECTTAECQPEFTSMYRDMT